MSDQGKGDDLSKVEEVQEKPARGGKIKRHFRRFWWLHVIIFIACLLIVVLCLVYVGVPKISQDNVNDSGLTIESLELSNPTPNSFHLNQTSTLENNSKYHPRLDSFNASLSLQGGKPFGYIQNPAVHATKRAIINVDQDVAITDVDAFTDFSNAMLNSDSVKVHIKGRPKLHEMKLPVQTVDFDKTVTIIGLNSFNGFNVTNFTVSLTPAPDGSNLNGTIYIPNPSPLTVAFGDLSFSTNIAGTPTFLGMTYLKNFTMVPGNNTIPFSAAINQTIAIGALSKFPDGKLPVDILGNSSMYNGQTLPYFQKALQGLKKTASLDAAAAFAALGIDPKDLASIAASGRAAPPQKKRSWF